MRRAWMIALAMGAVAFVGCDVDEPATANPGDDPGVVVPDPVDPDAATYYEHVKPILDTMCTRCHKPGGIREQVRLDTYEDASVWAPLVRLEVESRRMPPWKAVDGCTEYHFDESLTADEIATLGQWVDDGALAGDPEVTPAPMRQVEFATLSREDMVLEMPVEYTAQLVPDDYRCFLLPWEQETTKFVTGYGVKPGNDQVVHHVIAYIIEPSAVPTFQAWEDAEDGPGYTCFGGPNGPGGGDQMGSGVRFLAGWAPGGVGADFAPGTGIRVDPGSYIAFQVHYNSLTAEPQPDRSSIVFKLDDEVEHEALVMPWTNFMWILQGGMDIPAGESDVMHTYESSPWPTIASYLLGGAQALRLYSVALHMHNLGTSGRVWLKRADGTEDCLLTIDDYDFGWQRGYGLKEVREMGPGDQLGIECHWDNSAANQPMVGGQFQEPKDQTWGEGTGDEMCVGFFYVVPLHD